jgi:hypothetical protein
MAGSSRGLSKVSPKKYELIAQIKRKREKTTYTPYSIYIMLRH